MGSVAADDQISRDGRAVAQRRLDRVVVLIEVLDASAEAVVGLILRCLIQHIDQVAAQDLELGYQAVAVEGGDRHVGPTGAIGFDPRDTTLIEGALTHLVDKFHALDHIAARTAQVHGLSAWADAVGELNDRDAIPALGQPERQRRSRDTGTADQHGRPRRHGRQRSR
jgi:hypothetical protein